MQGVKRRCGQHLIVAKHNRVRLIGLSGPAERQHVVAVIRRRVVVDGVEVTHEERRLRVHRVIELRQTLMLGVVVRDPVDELTTWICGHRHVLQEIQRDGAQTRRVDAVAGKSACQIDLTAAVTCRRCDRREVTVQHGLRRNETDRRRRVAPLEAALVSAKYE